MPGATLGRDPKTFAIIYSNKGEPIWNMPKPIGVHETIPVVKTVDKSDPDKPKVKKVKQVMQFPVYRGIDASLARYYRAQVRRAKRKEKSSASAAED